MKIRLSIFLFIVLLFIACNEPREIEPRDTTISLSLITVTTNTAELKIAVADTSDFWSFKLDRDGSTLVIGECWSADTTIIDTNLSSGTNYSYHAYWFDGDDVIDSSNQVTIKTDRLTNIYLTSNQHDSTSVQLRLSVDDSTDFWFYEVIRDSISVLNGTVWGGDTVIYDTNLLPGTEYHYQAFWLENSTRIDSTDEISVTTDWDAETLWYLSFYPLQVGNRWKYEGEESADCPPEYFTLYIDVVGDTIMPNQYLYYQVVENFTWDRQSIRTKFYRVDPIQRTIYKYVGNSAEEVYYSLSSLQPADGQVFGVNTELLIYEYRWDDGEFYSYQTVKFAKGIGLKSVSHSWSGGVGGCGRWQNLRAAQIDTVIYGEF